MFVNADFAGAIKGKKTLSSMQSAVNDELARAKIEADKTALDIRIKLAWFKLMLNKEGDWFNSLYPDLQVIIYKQLDDFQLAVTSRIEAQKKLEAERASKANEQKVKCDGNHGGDSCGDKECWQIDIPPQVTKINLDEPVQPLLRKLKPTAQEVVKLVANAYGIYPNVALAWLAEIDFEAKVSSAVEKAA